MGTTEMTWQRFLLPVVSANLAIVFSCAACGAGIEELMPLLIATVVSGAVPLLQRITLFRGRGERHSYYAGGIPRASSARLVRKML